jgi:hypothetical protein
MSFMALEVLSRGRYVIWTHPLAGATLARTRSEVSRALRDLLDRHHRGALELNEHGRATTLARFGGSKQLDEIDRRLQLLRP